ncbi:MAG: SDR family NAD(P)-dependent oxidoreductase [Rhodospirillaceae bacterium]|nr:SDR family NAD(P)-dependent oxidoreductase [Rhodospirillaceae bacterium]MYH36454.1 SDR family NAD(P)-dependent oxidoreductase [Rhodospirillaceae bacterium]MYK14263.1 SDR family NAD(P)-dependent oxidoreductase [Rhodospirillaceae bacterium]MYK59180.1 SDR family NAD(P)-dependent oxidoreductase [Rhodospirillaceae bacterium]
MAWDEKKFSGSSAIRLLLIGRGYVARRLTGRLTGPPAPGATGADTTGAGGYYTDLSVLGATHRAGGAPRQPGDFPFGDSAAAGPLLAQATHLLISAPPDAAGDPTLRWLGRDGLAALPALRWIGYLSSTGVYGDHGGAWIDETAPLRPRGPTAERRARAEAQWLDARLDARSPAGGRRGLPVTVFRLSGIYGPGRSAFDALEAGTARRIDKPGHVFCRCHVDDICAVLRRSMAGAGAFPIYNVADDLPAPQRAAVEFAAGLTGAAPPPLTPYDPDALPAALRRFYEACRRIRNGRIKDELGVTLRYPTYREGLRAIAEEEGRV